MSSSDNGDHDPKKDNDPSHIPRNGDMYIFGHKIQSRFFAVVLDKTEKTVKFGKIPSFVKKKEIDEEGNNLYVIVPGVEGEEVVILRTFRCYKKSFKENASISTTDSNMKCIGMPYDTTEEIKTQPYF